ncbi:MAG: NUDIX hydrolase [Nanoarchaeota archaeon]|nr:NUDIX hydrolase [Nanoarchaeota archaeon]
MNKEVKLIFELFTKNHKLKFNQIEKHLNIRSNLLVYHLDKMKQQGLLEKQDDIYQLTKNAEEMLPFYAHLTQKETGVLPVVLTAIIKDNQICLIKRGKRPYKDHWGFVGGKIKMGESIKETALREAQEETSLDLEFDSIKNIVHEHTRENQKPKHSFLLILVQLNAKNKDFKITEEGELKWFDLDNLPTENIIHSDIWMIKNHLNKKINIPEIAMDEVDGNLVNLEEL